MKSMQQRKCAECGKPLFGRSDKKFCADGCRNAFNNKINAPANNFVRKINNVLGRNRRILLELNPRGKKKTHRDELLKRGFDFDYYTSSLTTRSGDVYRFCYDQGYLMLDSNHVLLVRKKVAS